VGGVMNPLSTDCGHTPINKGKNTVVPQEAVTCALAIDVVAHDLTIIVDAEG
jgi:hypothetical protein